MTDAVVLDVEGTTSSVGYVAEVLFPYGQARLADWVNRHRHEARTRSILDEVDRACGRPEGEDDQATVRTLQEWAESDRKYGPLKDLQGLIWAAGYANRELTGHVYDDTLPALRLWHGRGARIHIYSSGSVQAQRDLFSHTQHGDLTGWLTGYFDTRSAGGKLSADSYRTIARQIDVPARSILFASDSVAELDAAREAGWNTAWVTRAEGQDTSRDTNPAVANGHPRFPRLLDVADATHSRATAPR
ncbi:acireductone synthase [Streptomyces luteolus]|uniref:Enolase-phosphatase E1 n=1 Tax=Streptomyces luteolus TaxID=3043615 RepID=A0ABT6SQY7_9ACTN|nr:acireductone synthase [Streptomyces sp. B-S-A12]MDI3418018.1 acireductone synthase [Streptomyces sp. B-S-A12]